MLSWQMKCQFNQKPLKGAVELHTKFFFRIPKNTTYVKRQQMLNNVLHKISRPDLTNILKLMEDAGNGILWEDDSHIVKHSNEKLWGEEDKMVIMFKQL